MHKHNKKSKRFLSLFLAVMMTVSGLLGIVGTSAGAVSVDPLGYNLNNLRYTLSNGHSDGGWYVKTIGGKVAYCVQPGVAITGDYSSVLATGDTALKMSLADYYGRYLKTGNTLNTEEAAFNIFYTQLYVWGLVGVTPTALTDWSHNSTGKTSMSSYNGWKTEVEAKINAYMKTVSFAGQTVEIKPGESKTLTDAAGVFANYNLDTNTPGTTVTKNGNSVTIAANTSSTDGSIGYKYAIDAAYQVPSYYWNSDSGGQRLITTGISAPKSFQIAVKIEKSGNVKIKKVLLGTGFTTGNDCYGVITDAEFALYDSDKKLLQSGLKVNASGEFTIKDLVSGVYYARETKAPKGFILDDEYKKVTVVAGETATVAIQNKPLNDPIAILLKKLDAVTGESEQGSAGLEGAEFTIKYYGGYYSTDAELAVLTPVKTWVFKTNEKGVARFEESYLVSGDSFYYYQNSPDPTIPLGTISIQETKAPTGYLINDEIFIRQFLTADDGVSVKTYNVPEIPDEIKRGGIEVQKYDIETLDGSAQGDATLAGTAVNIINLNDNPVYVNGKTYAKNEVCATLTTDANGRAKSEADLLPFGKFRAEEAAAPNGYLNQGNNLSQEFAIAANGVIVSLDAPIQNNVIRGGVEVQKWDNEINAPQAQGGATLAGTEIELYNRSTAAVIVDGVTYQPGELITLLVTGEDGKAATTSDYLPFGTYEAIEKNPPAGYLKTGSGLSQTFEIRNNGEIVVLTDDRAIKNNPIRGDLKGLKIKDGGATHDRLANVPFKITSATTGESHVVVTDANGMFDTSTSWNPHSSNTNRGEAPEDGIWFGDIRTLDDEKGALLYDDYWIEEQPCAANEGLTLIAPFKVSVYKNSVTIDLGTLTNIVPPVPTIGTTAYEKKTGLSDIQVAEEVTVTDKVSYENLTADTEYVLKGVLMDKAANVPLQVNGEEVVSSTTFTPKSAMGTTTVSFTFDASALNGKNVVVFEYLTQNDQEIATHTDIHDEGQTVHFYDTPKIGTSAAEQETGDKEVLPTESVTVMDTVRYQGVVPGTEYVLKGILMDKETNAPLPVNGEEVVSEVKFTPAEATGTVEVPFTFAGNALAGKEVVVFETMYLEGKEVAVHADISDKDQTVRFRAPEIGTTAAEKDTGEKEILPGENLTLADTVSYTDLKPGAEYVLKGILMDKETNTPLVVKGEQVVSEVKFTPAEASGTAEVPFVFDGTAVAGKTVVVFETLYCDSLELAVHADIDDAGQTVRIRKPEIGTTAMEKDTGDKEILPGEKITLVDTVSYTDLKPGTEYVLKGILMDKETNTPLLVNGEQVVQEVKFTPKEASGSAEVTFTLDGSALAGKNIVAFETLYIDGKQLAVHADINDAGQTVHIRAPKIGTKAEEKGTGSKLLQPKENVTIVDTVSYTDLKPGVEYVLKGKLMDKATNKPLLVDGKEVVSEIKFTPETASGTVDVSFTLDSSTLAGKAVVVFETLYLDGKEIAAHADINDAGQSVTFDTPKTPNNPSTPSKPNAPKTPVPDTGDNKPTALVVGILVTALLCGGMLIWIYLHKKKHGRGNSNAA